MSRHEKINDLIICDGIDRSLCLNTKKTSHSFIKGSCICQLPFYVMQSDNRYPEYLLDLNQSGNSEDSDMSDSYSQNLLLQSMSLLLR